MLAWVASEVELQEDGGQDVNKYPAKPLEPLHAYVSLQADFNSQFFFFFPKASFKKSLSKNTNGYQIQRDL